MVTEVDHERSAARIEREIETLSGPDFTTSSEAIRRYAYTPEYRRTLDHFATALEELGFTVTEDPLGTLVARNRPAGEPVFGLGSHCDSNRNGGRYDGTMGVVTALEVCRLSAEHGLDLPPHRLVRLAEELAALAVADDHVAAVVGEHRNAHLARERALCLPIDVLGAGAHARPAEGVPDRAEVRERHADGDVTGRAAG